jgi:hypothetical protein
MFSRLGIEQDILMSAGISRLTDSEALAFGFSHSGNRNLAGFLIPYFDPETGARVTARLRRDNPEIDTDGKPRAKYLSPVGDNRHLYFPPGSGDVLRDNTVPVIFVEAEKSSLALTCVARRTGRKWLVVGTGGCYSWRGKTGISQNCTGQRVEQTGPLPDLSRPTWDNDRVAIIMFDSDTRANRHVRHARWEFAKVLAGNGARVLFASIPDQPNVNGPDDLVSVAGDGTVVHLIENAQPFQAQLERETEMLISTLSSQCDFNERDHVVRSLAFIQSDVHRRVLIARAAASLGEDSGQFAKEVAAQVALIRKDQEETEQFVKKARLLATKVDPSYLIGTLRDFLKRRLVLPVGADLVLALFILNTYVFDVFDTTPYIEVDSPLGGCGKTILLLHLEAVCARSYLGADPSEAALFRKIDRDRPTWLLDEASVIKHRDEKANAIRAILDAGYRKGASIPRCDGRDRMLRDFAVYCPKVFALVGTLSGTLLDKCICLHLEKKEPPVKTRLKALRREAAPLREMLEAYDAQYRPTLDRLYAEEPVQGYWPQFDGREDDLWSPLLYHAKLAGKDMEDLSVTVALKFAEERAKTALAEDTTLAMAQELLEVITHLGKDRFCPRDMVSDLEKKETWGGRFDNCKTQKSEVSVVGKFISKFRTPDMGL